MTKRTTDSTDVSSIRLAQRTLLEVDLDDLTEVQLERALVAGLLLGADTARETFQHITADDLRLLGKTHQVFDITRRLLARCPEYTSQQLLQALISPLGQTYLIDLAADAIDSPAAPRSLAGALLRLRRNNLIRSLTHQLQSALADRASDDAIHGLVIDGTVALLLADNRVQYLQLNPPLVGLAAQA